MTGFTHAPARRSQKRFWFVLHGWMALPIWGLLAFICVTGTICVLSEEINWVITPESRAANPHQNEPLPFANLIAAVEQSYPGSHIRSIQISQSYLAQLFRISTSNGDSKILYVNQYTGEVQGEVNRPGFRGFIIALHGWLLFPWQDDYSLGWYLVTALSIPLLGSVISGLVIFKHFYRVLYKPVVRVNMGSRVFWGDLHRLIAAWSIWFVIIMSVSGLWFLVQGILTQNHVEIFTEKVQLNDELISAEQNVPQKISADQAVVKAKKIYPGLSVTYMEFPVSKQDTFFIQGTKAFSLFRANANVINLNPYSGDVIFTRSTDNLSPTQFLSALLTPLHFGDFGGLAVKLIWFFFGCMVSTLVCSGFIIWTKRTIITIKLRKFNAGNSYSQHNQHFSRLDTLQSKRQKRNRKLLLFLLSWMLIAAPIYFFINDWL